MIDNLAKSVKPLTWQRRARIGNNLCVETLHEVPKQLCKVKTKPRPQTMYVGSESYSGTNPLVPGSSPGGGAIWVCAGVREPGPSVKRLLIAE